MNHALQLEEPEQVIQVSMRAATEADVPLIFHSFAHQIRHSEPFCTMDPDQFRAHKRNVLEPLLMTYGAIVACDPEDDSHVLGWIIADTQERVVHFVYVKSDFRGLGIARELLNHSIPRWKDESFKFSHKSRSSLHLAKKWKARYDPYSVLLLNDQRQDRKKFAP